MNKTKYPQGFDVILKLNMSQTCFGVWDMTVKKYKLLAVEAIKYNNCPYLEINDLWYALYLTFNSAQNQQVDVNILNEFPDKHSTSWSPFSREKSIRLIAKCSNLSALGPNKLF